MKNFQFFFFLKSLCFLSLVCIGLFSYSEKKKIPAKEIQSLNIRVVKSKVLLTYKKSKDFNIEVDSSFFVEVKDNVLEVKDRSYDDSSSWKPSRLASKKYATLKIQGPSRPVSLFSGHLDLKAKKWKSPVFVSSQDARVVAQKNEGPWQLFSKKSDIHFDSHKSSVYLKGNFSNIILDDLSTKKDSYFYFNEGLLEVKEGSGNLNFTTDKGKIKISKFTGDLMGSTQSGPVNVTITPQNLVDVSSEEGELRFFIREGASPRLSAYTERGKIYAPVYMHKDYSGKSLKVTGRFKGTKRKGKVLLKTDVGKIFIY